MERPGAIGTLWLLIVLHLTRAAELKHSKALGIATMTPVERQLISDLFDRMRGDSPAEKDREAERFISDSVHQIPDAGYLLVQSVLAQDFYLQQAGGRIEELEGRLRDLEAQLSSRQNSGGGLFGGLLGTSRRS